MLMFITFIVVNCQTQLVYLLKPDYRKSFINSLGLR